MTDRIEADYLIETPVDPRAAAEAMAGEQSSGALIALRGETPELKALAGGAPGGANSGRAACA